ncbi:hypothetical protein E2C01_015013 [Portunus trituberculatus]|uniref:Uncharacterized protein n=1 Tax=Portunus trituberculatus TaxID=210409 RepID=A0A5B7DKN8_PORTR|nr:hypothetical protein [Portunus trituberculatus]
MVMRIANSWSDAHISEFLRRSRRSFHSFVIAACDGQRFVTNVRDLFLAAAFPPGVTPTLLKSLFTSQPANACNTDRSFIYTTGKGNMEHGSSFAVHDPCFTSPLAPFTSPMTLFLLSDDNPSPLLTLLHLFP